MESVIQFFEEDIKFTLSNPEKTITWIYRSVLEEHKQLGEVNYIFCSDDYLHKINMDYLNHDTLTDIITFDNSEEDHLIEGDIFISIDRITENARELNTTFQEELARVMIHGVLHLVGYNDKTPEQSQEMRIKEDHYLSLLI